MYEVLVLKLVINDK